MFWEARKKRRLGEAQSGEGSSSSGEHLSQVCRNGWMCIFASLNFWQGRSISRGKSVGDDSIDRIPGPSTGGEMGGQSEFEMVRQRQLHKIQDDCSLDIRYMMTES